MRSKTPIQIMSGDLVITGRSWDGRPVRLTVGRFYSKGAESLNIVEEVEYTEVCDFNGSPVTVSVSDRSVSLMLDVRILEGEGSEPYLLEYLDGKD